METISYPQFRVDDLPPVKYLFFTGKGGVGKTSLACSVAVTLADAGQRVLLISTDPASNLQDVFSMKLSSQISTLSRQLPHIASVRSRRIAACCPTRRSATWRNSSAALARSRSRHSMNLPAS